MATATATTGAPPTRRLHRLERAALQGVLMREVVNFSSFWRSSTFSSTVDPTIYLLAFGFGFGSLVSRVAGYRYIDFVGTGIVATTVLFSGAFTAMYSTSSSTSSSTRTTRSSLLPSTPRSSSRARRCGSPPARASTDACRCSSPSCSA